MRDVWEATDGTEGRHRMTNISRLLAATLTCSSALALNGCAATLDTAPASPTPRTLDAAEAEAAVAPSLPIMKEMTKRLAADEFEGRAPSTAVESKVLEYTVP